MNIKNVGKTGAINCLGQLSFEPSNTSPVKLHWADTSYEFLSDSAIKIDINPTEERRLDIAFSHCGEQSPVPSLEPVLGSMPVSSPYSCTSPTGARISEGTVWTGSMPVRSRAMEGTIDTGSLIGLPVSSPYSNTSPTGASSFYVQKESLEGAWIASNRVIGNPIKESRDYLSPGRYQISVEVKCENGIGDNAKLVIISNKNSWKLNADLRKTTI